MSSQSFSQVFGGNAGVGGDASGGGGGFGGGSGGLGVNGGGDGGNGLGGAGDGPGGGGAGIGGGGGGCCGGGDNGSPGSGTIAGLTNTGTIAGGAGGNDAGGGGAGIGGGGGDAFGGGNGGDAGFAISNSTIMNSGTISGGAGGSGFIGGAGGGGAGIGSGGAGYSGGAGGAGLNGLTIINSGTIVGGDGGLGSGGPSGIGGVGIGGSGLSIINSGTITGGMSGDGVTQAGAIAFTGGTNILELQAGSTISGNVVAFSTADTLRLGGNTDASFDVSQIGATAQYQGFGFFEKTGTSTWALTGTNSDPTLPWTIDAGTLEVDGSIASSSVVVNSGGTLSGTGTIGDPVINGGGTLSPGSTADPYGTLTIADPLTFMAGSFYTVHISPSANSFTQVNSTAALGGATVNAIYASGSYVAKRYTILTATNGVSGTFGSLVNTNLPATFSASLSYDANDAYLNLALGFSGPNIPGGLNANQQAVGNALINYFNNTGGIPLIYGALTAQGLSQASGETATGTQQTTFSAINLFMGLLTDPFAAGRDDAPGAGASGAAADGIPANALGYTEDSRKPIGALAAIDKRARREPVDPVFNPYWKVWAAGFGGSENTDGSATRGSNKMDSSIFGAAAGADYHLSPNTVTGFAFAGAGTNFSIPGYGSGSSNLFQAGAFLRHTIGPAYITAAVAYGWQDVTTNRTLTLAGFDRLQANFNPNIFSERLEGGYRLSAPIAGGIGVTPYAAAQIATFVLPSYGEYALSGSSAFALNYASKTVTDSRSELGLRVDKSYALVDAVLTLRGSAAWAHDFDSDRSVAATFQALPGASFIVNGAALASNSALTNASAELGWKNGWSVAATFDGEFSGVTRSYAGKGTVRYVW